VRLPGVHFELKDDGAVVRAPAQVVQGGGASQAKEQTVARNSTT